MPKSPKDRQLRREQSLKEEFGPPQEEGLGDLVEDRLLDGTMYGEIIPSLMGWITPDDQRARVDKLEKLSKNSKRKKPVE